MAGHNDPTASSDVDLADVAADRTRFDPIPSRRGAIAVDVAAGVPAAAGAHGVPVGTSGAVPRSLGLDRATLTAAGFDGKVGQTYVVARKDAADVVAVGVGDQPLAAAAVRDVAAAFARAASGHAEIALTMPASLDGNAGEAIAAAVEGAILARYRFRSLKSKPNGTALQSLTIVAGRGGATTAATKAARRGADLAAAGCLARDLANTPPSHLTATRIAEIATELGSASRLDVEVFGPAELGDLGCGGLLGVNAGSVEEPRMVRLTYRPRRGQPGAKLALVGKGVMYDSGGISLKPSNPSHAQMKMDMSGAAAVLAAMSSLDALGCRNEVTGYLMCTDNMPSGSAMKLGDVLHIHGGTTVEVHNTDAEGRLVLADGLALASEAQPDAIVDIATLTGACMVALGLGYAGVFASDDALAEQISTASTSTDERTWRLPLEARYRKSLDSDIADIKNVGGPYGGAITAAVFLSEFVGDVPWAHLDIAGPMNNDGDESWRTKGASGFGARLLAELATSFSAPRSD